MGIVRAHLVAAFLAGAVAQSVTSGCVGDDCDGFTASCGLGSDIDPDNVCKVSPGEWGNLNIDAYGDAAAIKLKIEKKTDIYVDNFWYWHGVTEGDLDGPTDGRYILHCPQEEGDGVPNKTVSFTIERPSSMTEFGAEWVKLYPKDSWDNVTNEYEPWTMNQYGAKIAYLREWDGVTLDAEGGPLPEAFDNVTVYMEVSGYGDFEVKYGNPQIYTTSAAGEERWVAVEFKQTLLRVGSPWAKCGATDELADEEIELGSVVPALFGHPNLNLGKYTDFLAEVSAADVPIAVVLEIFGPEIGTYTMSEAKAALPSGIVKTEHPSGDDYTKCYEAGNACPEGHSVCKATYCELDTFEKIIKDLQAAGISVLGAVGEGITKEDYDILDQKVDGFFYTALTLTDGYLLDGEVASADGKFTVAAIGEPLFDTSKVGTADSFVTLSLDETGVWNPYSWYPLTPADKWVAIIDNTLEDAYPDILSTLVDRGYGYIYITDQDGFNTTSTYNAAFFGSLAGAAEPASSERRLQKEARRLQDTTYSWGCDDTLLHCSPICLAQTGVVTTISDESMCAGAPMDACKCKCYYDAKWECQGGSVVCMASRGIEPPAVVGDLVCETRGTPKPTLEQMKDNQRQAGECEPLPTTRGWYPTKQCLTQWATDAEEPEVEEPEVEEVEEVEGTTVAPAVEETQDLTIEVDASFAAAVSVLVALTQ
jgi:hypothetical protein